MALKLVFDFTNAKDPETGEGFTREELWEEFGPGNPDWEALASCGVVTTIEED